MAQTTNLPAVKPSPVTPIRHEHDGSAPSAGGAQGGGHDSGDQGIPKDLQIPSTGKVIVAVSLFVLLLIALFLIGWIPDHRERSAARSEAEKRSKALPVVSFMIPSVSPGTHDVTLPCDVKANAAATLYPRTNGYLKAWHFDVGASVKKDELMAEIDTPEVDAQLKQSQASLEQNQAAVKRADADLDLALVTLHRYVDAQSKSPGSVTQEDVDTRKSAVKDAEAARGQSLANVDAAKANVEQLSKQVGFEKVMAPFDGKVTKRYTDVGALLSPTNPIFDFAQTDPLRVYVNVPQEYANDVKLNEKAQLYVRNFPARPFEGVISRTAGAVDPVTRTLSVQIDFANKDGDLYAGEYGEIHLPVQDPNPVQLIPTSSLLFNAKAHGNQVAVLDEQNKVHMKPIKTGRDFGTVIEVSSGLTKTDRVITNPSERVSEGAQVDAKEAPHDGVTSPAPSTKPTTPQ